MIIAIRKPSSNFFMLKNITAPLKQGWRISRCGNVAISLVTHYYCNGISITGAPVEISDHTKYQLFACISDTYVYIDDIGICDGNMHHTFYIANKLVNEMPSAMKTTIINNLNVAGVVA